jgi:serine phosphatase RsbU (regulator of sigma subunit)
MLRRSRRHTGFTAFIIAGLVLAVALLAQTVWTYVFVSRDLVRREARRQAARDVTALERAIFAARVGDPASLSAMLTDLHQDSSARVAWVSVLDIDAKTLAGSSANQQTLFTPAEVKAPMFARGEPSTAVWRDNREILVYVFPLRLPPRSREPVAVVPPVSGADQAPAPALRRPGPVLAEIGIYRDAVSAQFGGLRQASIVNALAACALLAALTAMALRFPAYVRGRQMDVQLLLARRVQEDLLPASMPVLLQAEVNAVCIPAFDVGGDLFDFVSLDEDRFVFLVGDVSGKGVSAALLMAVVHGAFHGGELRAAGGDLGRWMSRLNTLLIQRSAENRFVTLFCGIFDARTATVTYVNGGHLPPLLFRAGARSPDPEPLETGGPVVGLLPGATYEEGRTIVRKGDVLLLYSDGVTEATDRNGAEFGRGRLSTTVASEVAGDLRIACSRVLETVETFATRTEPEDDQTVMLIRFGGQRSSTFTSAQQASEPSSPSAGDELSVL